MPPNDVVELVGQVMSQHGWTPPPADTGAAPDEINELVQAVHGHPRALVLLSREIAERGVRTTTADLRTLMAELDRIHPGERENSLYASVALSLRRLSLDARRDVRALACCHGGAHLATVGHLTGLDIDVAGRLMEELVEVGLGEDMGYGHLRLDPALGPYLLAELSPAIIEEQRARRLTLWELPDLVALLAWLPDHCPPEDVVELAARVEALVGAVGQPRALALAVRTRERAAEQLASWGSARHEAAAAKIKRLLDEGELAAALTAARGLLDQHIAEGDRLPRSRLRHCVRLLAARPGVAHPRLAAGAPR